MKTAKAYVRDQYVEPICLRPCRQLGLLRLPKAYSGLGGVLERNIRTPWEYRQRREPVNGLRLAFRENETPVAAATDIGLRAPSTLPDRINCTSLHNRAQANEANK